MCRSTTRRTSSLTSSAASQCSSNHYCSTLTWRPVVWTLSSTFCVKPGIVKLLEPTSAASAFASPKLLSSSAMVACAVERALDTVKSAIVRAKSAAAALKRLQGELIDERLAELSPLISELYLRLRPHVDWRTIHYRLRGDVRRMLSFQIGDGLNPFFIFSSGQRRAAGLAFLLAVHLSRRWCRLNTLIMDDPVQHIDDFRALNLAEVLGSIRQDGRQVICAVEDEALGSLLCRRLRSSPSAEGVHVRMAYDSERGVHIEGEQKMRASGSRVLVSA